MAAAEQDLTQRVNWTIRGTARRIVDLAGAGGSSISHYISTLIPQRDAEWRAALECLLGRGWSKSSIRIVCEANPNPPAFPLHAWRWLSDSNVDIDRVTEAEGRAFLILAKEYATQNADLERRLK